MLTQNQKIVLDFESKISKKVDSLSYKEGEIDKSGIEIECLGVSLEQDVVISAHWLHSSGDQYIYVENTGERIDESNAKVYPPQNTLARGEVGLEVHLESELAGVIKSQTVTFQVVPSLIDDEEASAEDENLNVILNLINATNSLHDAAEALDAEMQAAEVIYSQNEDARKATFETLEASVAINISSANDATTAANAATIAANTAKDGANSAATNADQKAALANNAATNANVATESATSTKTTLDESISTANTTKSAVDSSAANANTKAALANDKAVLADQKATLANTAATNANTAAANATNAISEVVAARSDYFGNAHNDIDARMKADFSALASRIPTGLNVSGTETVTTNNTLDGVASGTEVVGRTWVNARPKSVSFYGGTKKDDYTISFDRTAESSVYMHVSDLKNTLITEGKKYTIVYKITFETMPTTATDTRLTLLNLDLTQGFEQIKIQQNGIGVGTHRFVRVYTANWGGLTTTNRSAMMLWNGTVGAKGELGIELILEGDHTDKPIEFFEGLKSAEVDTVKSKNADGTKNSSVSLANKIVLRSLPNGVADTYDVDTRVLTRRTGEVVLNGSESWRVASGWNGDSSSGFEFSLETIKHVSMTNLYCDKFQAANIVASNGKNVELIYSGSTNSVFVKILNSKLPTPDVAGFKAWLAQNPTTVVYQLATPTTEVIDNTGLIRSYDNQTTISADSVVPADIKSRISVDFESTLTSALSQVQALKVENETLREQIDTEVAAVKDELNQIHVAIYKMMSFNQGDGDADVVE